MSLYYPFSDAIEAAPLEPINKLAWADWILDRREYAADVDSVDSQEELAFALRWLAHHRHWPHHRLRYPGTRDRPAGHTVPEQYSWGWYPSWMAVSSHRRKELCNPPDHALLPPLVFASMGSRNADHRFCASLGQALKQLATGLAFMKELLDLPPLPVTGDGS